jgi:hypothetical protein
MNLRRRRSPRERCDAGVGFARGLLEREGKAFGIVESSAGNTDDAGRTFAIN